MLGFRLFPRARACEPEEAIVRLISPSIEFEASYRSYLAELGKIGERPIPWVLAWEAADFAALVMRLLSSQEADNVEDGFVEHVTFWMVDDERELVGVANLRLRLNKELVHSGGHVGYGVRPSMRNRGYATQLLAMTLHEAKRLGIRRVLVCCDQDNPASARVIRKNGGVFESEVEHQTGSMVDRYWIDQ